MEWKDTTSYQRGQERNPTTWTAQAGPFKIVLVSAHHYYPGEWVLHIYPGPLVSEHTMGPITRPLTEVVAEAEQVLRTLLTKALAALDVPNVTEGSV